MEFRTTVKTGENRSWLHHSDSVVLLGSCFSDNMGGKSRQFRQRPAFAR